MVCSLCAQVRPKVEFCSLLQHAGATKDVFTMKEVMFYLGRYIMQKQLYDQKQQHMVHCAQDALGRVLGVDSFSVKEPRVLFAMITKNLVAVNNKEGGATEAAIRVSFSLEAYCSHQQTCCSDSTHLILAGPSQSVEEEDEAEEEEEGEGRKRRRSDSYSLTFDDSLSWCVIGGLVSGRDRQSSQSSSSESTVSPSKHFWCFQVYEVTIFEADDEDSFDEDTEITEADYWRCSKCDELNPPLPRNCLRCWDLRQDWLPNQSANAASSPKALPTKPNNQSDAKDAPGTFLSDSGHCSVPNSQDLLSLSQPSSSSSSQEKLWTPESQPCSSSLSSDVNELLPSSPTAPPPPQCLPELERSVSAEWRLPDSCLDPCLICQSRPKNGCIVHGRTGHLMSCYVCARKLKKRNKLCPVCRMPIQSVVLTYLS
uniref:MDM2 proto-oncogene n=1 Tax=Oryzias latipes TaxID=8090 RepID=A0A3P9KAB9_ORYLA